jgi:spore cortex formation protein SpoVR/YcgB (stage V sporulation)
MSPPRAKASAPRKKQAAVPKKGLAGALPTGCDWTFRRLEAYDQRIGELAARFGLDCYPHQLEIITAEQMMDAYASIGMPVLYHHWSFGKHFLSTEKNYKRGRMGLAYEIVINSDPCVAYLMEENSLTMQALVIAHAAYGHNSFFKGNYLFKTWTQADAIIDYLVFARRFIADCEERHGVDTVEQLLDACHALMNVGVDRYKRPPSVSDDIRRERREAREEYRRLQFNDLWRTLPPREHTAAGSVQPRFPEEPQENLLYFIEKQAPLLEPWQREIVRIVRKVAQYFYPQQQTQVMNEGWACFWHYTLLNTLHEEGAVGDGFMLEFLHAHTNVVAQPPYNSPYYSGINPYALGYAMWQDIRRICDAPTEEDQRWFPDIAGTPWRETFDFAMRNFKDESFIAQYLSPALMRQFRLFAVVDNDREETLGIEAIHDDSGYRRLREVFSEQYNLATRTPDIQVWNVDFRGDRSLTLRHFQHNRRPLHEDIGPVMHHIAWLWGFPVRLETVSETGEVSLAHETHVEKRREHD